jgi:hypothetical protein
MTEIMVVQGKCDAAVMSEESMLYGFSGGSNVWDCGELDSNKLTSFDAVGDPTSSSFKATAESGMCLNQIRYSRLSRLFPESFPLSTSVVPSLSQPLCRKQLAKRTRQEAFR